MVYSAVFINENAMRLPANDDFPIPIPIEAESLKNRSAPIFRR